MEKSSCSSKSTTHLPTNNPEPTTDNFQTPDSTIWVSCPYCCNLFLYEKDYENCSLRCQNCMRGFNAVPVPSPPPVVPGMDAYYCSWGCFPMGYWVKPSLDFSITSGKPGLESESNAGFSSWKPFSPMFGASFHEGEGSIHVPDWDVEASRREKMGADGFMDHVNSSSQLPSRGVNEEPLLAVPINVRPPETKEAAMKAKKQTSKREAYKLGKRWVENLERLGPSCGNHVGENFD